MPKHPKRPHREWFKKRTILNKVSVHPYYKTVSIKEDKLKGCNEILVKGLEVTFIKVEEDAELFKEAELKYEKDVFIYYEEKMKEDTVKLNNLITELINEETRNTSETS